MPGRPSASRSLVTGGVITPRSSATSGSSPSASRAASNGARPRTALPGALERVLGVGGHGPVGDEAAEVVDAGEVEELEDALEACRPPRVALPPQRRPVIERVAPELALVGERVRRHAGHGAGLEDLRMRELVGRALGDVDRDVADQLHPAVGGVGAQGAPFAVEAHLVVERLQAGEGDPVLDPAGRALAEVQPLRGGHRRVRLAQQLRRRGERGRGLVGRVVLVGRPERQHLPPRLARVGEPVDPRVSVRTEPAARAARSGAIAPRMYERGSCGRLVGYSTARCPHRSAANLRAGSGSQNRRPYSMVVGTPSSAP